jgi:hypothetical protein
MAIAKQLTGMRGVYLVAAELLRQGLIASATSRSAIGADILAIDQQCVLTYSVQVKTNARTFGFWLGRREGADALGEPYSCTGQHPAAKGSRVD